MNLRHRNGRGLLLDDAEANSSTYIDKTSQASGSAKLRDCRLEDGSRAEGNCQIYGGTYRGTIIRSRTVCAGRPFVMNSILDCSEVSGKPTIYGATLWGQTELCDAPVIKGASLRDAIIYGEPIIIGDFTVTGRVHEGTWTRAPKHIKLPWTEITECINGKIIVACRCKPADWWLKHGPKLAKRWDWSQDMIDVTLETIRREFVNSIA